MAPETELARRPRWPDWLAAVVIGAAVWLVFRHVAGGAFLQWDDDINIRNNPHVHGLSWPNLRWMFTDSQYMRRYLPLGWLRWAADYQFYGPGPRSFHIGNLILHLADAVLLFVVIRQVLARWAAPNQAPAGWAVLAAAIGSLVWALHPLRVEAVSWASTGQYCQSVLFLLLSVLAYLRFADRSATVSAWRSGSFWASVVLFLGSLLTYPVALGYAGALVVMDIFLLRRLPLGAKMWNFEYHRVWLEKVPYIVVTSLVLAATIGSRYQARGIWQPPPTLSEFGLGSRLMQAGYVWAYYLWKPLWPAHLAPVYTALVSFHPTDTVMIASAAVVLGITGLFYWRRREWPGLFAIWLCHLALLVPMLGFSEHPHFTNDRYCYLSAIPWSLALAALLFRCGKYAVGRWVIPVGAALLLLLCGRASAAQIRVWRDSETLFRYVLAQLGSDPYAYDIWLRLGRVQVDAGELPAAEASFRGALRLRPEAGEARAHLGLILFNEGRRDEAATFLGRAAETDPLAADVRSAMVNALLRAGWLPETLQYCETVARLNPSLPDAQGNLGVVLALSGRASEGLPHLREAVRLDSKSVTTHFNLGLALRNLRRNEEARSEFETVLQLEPKFAPAQQALAALGAPQKP